MLVFLILAPFAAFATLMLIASADISLFAAGTLGLSVVAYDWWRGRTLKMIGTGSTLLFLGLGLYITLIDHSWTNHALVAMIDGGVLAIALLSLAIGMPFTQQYAHDKLGAEAAAQPAVLSISYRLTWAWTAAFALMLLADALTIYVPSLPLWIGAGVAFLARNGAMYFTKWYPQHHRLHHPDQATA